MGNCLCFAKKHIIKGTKATELTQTDAPSPHNPNGFFTEYTFINAQGLELHGYEAQPKGRKRGVVVLQHGVNAHALWEYLIAETPGGLHTQVEGSFAGCLLANGFAVHLLDLQGHGKSDAARDERFFFEEFDDLAKDFLHFVELVRKREQLISRSGYSMFGPPADLPIFASGLSMGGGVVVGAAMKSPEFVKGLILFAPMLSLERLAKKPINKILRPLASLVSTVCPTARIAQTEKNTTFPHMEDEMQNDPMCNHIHFACARTAAECIQWSDFMTKQGGFAMVKTPFITLHSPTDNYVDPASSEGLMTHAQTQDKQVYWADGMWHCLTNEPGKEKIFEKVMTWLDEHC